MPKSFLIKKLQRHPLKGHRHVVSHEFTSEGCNSNQNSDLNCLSSVTPLLTTTTSTWQGSEDICKDPNKDSPDSIVSKMSTSNQTHGRTLSTVPIFIMNQPHFTVTNKTQSPRSNVMLPLEDGRRKRKQPSQDFTRRSENKTSRCYVCSECGRKYATSSNLSRHRQTHRSLDGWHAKHCPYCRKAYVSMPALAMHVLTHDLKYR